MFRLNHLVAGLLIFASVTTLDGSRSSQAAKPASSIQPAADLQNVALGKPVIVITNGAEDDRESPGLYPSDITDGSLDYLPSSWAQEDGCVGYVNDDYNQLMEIIVIIDLQGTYDVSRIRYNMGNAQRAESWNADLMTTPLGASSTNPGTPYSGTWTEHTGSATLSRVTVVLEKTRTSYTTDWLFIGEIEVYGTASTPEPPYSISEVEINQVLGRQYSDPPKFVAGKDTAIRVFLSAPVTAHSTTQRVIVKRDGNTVTTLTPVPLRQPSSVLTFVCPSRSACGNWQAGSYTFDVIVNGLSDQATATFQQSGSRRMLAVPVRVRDGGVVKGLPDDQWKTAAEFLREVYPIANDSVDWELGPELDATGLDLTNSIGQNILWFRLWRRQPLLCGTPFRPPCYDHIIGFIPPMPICDGSGCLLGWTKPPPFPRVSVVMANGTFIRTVGHSQETWNIDDMQSTIAHEIGHNFGLGDEYDDACGLFQCDINPPPPSYRGQQPWLPFLCNYTCDSSTVRAWPGPGTGSMILGDQDRPFQVNGRQALGDMLSFMGAGALQSNYWITPPIYDHLFDQLSPSIQAASDLQQPVGVVQAFGWIGQDDSVTLEPWYDFTTTLSTPVSGTYTIEAVDAMSQTLASQGFEVSFVMLSDPPQEIDPAPFEVVVAFPTGTKAFRIKRGDAVLRVIPVSPNRPTVTVTAPTSGQVVSGIYTATWQSSDLDGGPLYHTVEYSHDGEDWLVLALPLNVL